MGLLNPSQSVSAACVVGLLLGLAGCERRPVEYLEPFVAVHGVMLAGADSAHFRVERAEPARDRLMGVSDALVTLDDGTGGIPLDYRPETTCADTTALFHISDGGGCYNARLPGPVAPGTRYTMTVELPDGHTVTGETYVPRPPRLRILEQPIIEVPLEHPWVSVHAEWDVDPEVGGVEVHMTMLAVHTPAVGWLSREMTNRQCILDDPAIIHDPRDGRYEFRLTEVGCPRISWDSMEIEVRSTAYDSAYARYIDAVGGSSVGTPLEDAAAGLDGALGVFGGAASSVDVFYLLLDRQ